MFDYQVMTEDQANTERYSLLHDGIYELIVIDCISKISSNNNNMFELTFSLNGRMIKDFLVFSPQMMWKVIHFCKVSGLEKEYLEKTLTPNIIINKKVHAYVAQQDGKLIPEDKLNGKPFGTKYSPKNIITDYVAKPESKPSLHKPLADVKSFQDDDLPF